MSEICSNPYKYSKDDLILRPFPQNLQGKEYWTQNRKDLISYSGIALFVFGNKKDEKEKIVLSTGMREEFEIAKENNLLLVPIGATGYISEEFYKELENSYKDCELYKKLGDKTLEPNEMIDTILNFLNKYK